MCSPTFVLVAVSSVLIPPMVVFNSVFIARMSPSSMACVTFADDMWLRSTEFAEVATRLMVAYMSTRVCTKPSCPAPCDSIAVTTPASSAGGTHTLFSAPALAALAAAADIL